MKRFMLLLIFLVVVSAESLFAQDPAFSQFFASPLTLNPALTGKFNGVVRIAGNYRNQWPTINNAFITSTISADAGILKKKLSEGDVWAVGLMLMKDKTASGVLSGDYISLSTAYHKTIDVNGWHQVGIGVQGTYGRKSLDGARLHFSDELDPQGGWTIPSREAVNDRYLNQDYFGVNAGFLYNGSSDGYNNFYFGTSVYHINRPRESFTGNTSYILHQRITFHGAYSLPLSFQTTAGYIRFSGLYSTQGPATNIVLGGALSGNINNDDDNPVNVYAGSWVRFSNLTDAIIPYVGLDFSDFSLGVSYDVNISSLKPASGSLGGIEISLIYIKRPVDRSKFIPCPRF